MLVLRNPRLAIERFAGSLCPVLHAVPRLPVCPRLPRRIPAG